MKKCDSGRSCSSYYINKQLQQQVDDSKNLDKVTYIVNVESLYFHRSVTVAEKNAIAHFLKLIPKESQQEVMYELAGRIEVGKVNISCRLR